MTEPTHSHPLELNALTLPAAPSWWPLGPGWWAAAFIAIAITLVLFFLYRRRSAHKRAQRAALNLFNIERSLLTPSSAIELVRQAALSYFPRQDIAKLSGQDWYQFLDSQLASATFLPNKEQWDQALYRSSSSLLLDASENQSDASENQSNNRASLETADHVLIEHCEQWIQRALPPKRKYRHWKRGE
ncbi:DUF4381 domain-containing protein [Vibrio sp. E150_011]